MGRKSAPRTVAQWRVSRVYWLSILGLLIWTLFAASGRIPGLPEIQTGAFLFILLLATINLSCRSWERNKRTKPPDTQRQRSWGWLFLAVDLILIIAGLRVTGGTESPLWVVLFLVGVSETILTTSGEAHLILAFGIIALVLGTFPIPANLIDSRYLLEIVWRGGMLYAVSSVTRRLRENSDEDKRENATLRAELALAEERARLSREIHDGVGNSLAAAVLRLEVAARTLAKDRNSEPPPEILREEARVLREAMTAVRDWTFFTRPWSTGSDEASCPHSLTLSTEVDRIARRTGLPMTVEGATEIDQTTPSVRLTILRIIQEALTNAAKHAKNATKVELTLHGDGSWLTLTISDDGAGFDVESAGTGIGLTSMRERAEGIGGSFLVRSSPETGTVITVTLPTEGVGGGRWAVRA